MGPVRSAGRFIGCTVSAIALLLAAACGGDDSNGPAAPTGTGIAIVAGNFQLAKYGTSVNIAPAVRITNAAGPVAGAQVVFAPASGSGSVTGGSAVTDANGVATVGSWTLSPAPGTNTLNVTSGTLSVSLSATAVPGPATTIEIVAGNNQSGVERASVSTPPQVRVTDGTFPIRFLQVDFALVSGGGTIVDPNQSTNAEGLATLGAWKLGSAGVNTISATVRNTSLTTTFTATAAVLQVKAVTVVEGSGQTGFYGNFASERATVLVQNQFDGPAEGVQVTFSVTAGGGVITKAVDTTDVDGHAEIGSWRYGSTATQSLSAVAGVASPPPPVSFTATASPVPPTAFKIDVRYPNGEPSAAVKAAFTQAAAKWSTIVVGDLDDIVLAGADVMGPYAIEGEPCIPLVANQTIDDVVIFAYVKPIDGAQGILGFATPIYTRDNDTTTVSGCMTFDQADMDELAAGGQLEATIAHEMGHVLGIGTLWENKELAKATCASNRPTANPYFIGGSARQAFRAALGAGVAWSDSMVPLEGTGSCFNGTRDGHPSEGIFVNELMTGYIDQFSNPLSAVSAGFLRDLGLTVNDAAADPYTIPYGLPALRTTAPAGRKLNEMHVDAPIQTIDRRGRVQRIMER